ncbi:MAG: glycoside hydrolase family 3 C-terminal domain-containing protein [Bacteroidales bacterium]|nr:glycoside hydrolase family 3 C-terminal domain-containing protein [Bacteroidales bacterium]
MRSYLLLPAVLFCQLCFLSSAQSPTGEMTLEEKARCVVGINRSDFPPTNQGICARTAAFPVLGVPTLALGDGSSGVRLSRREKDRATAFPCNMALASSWNPGLAGEVGAAAGYEALGYNINVLLAPGINIIRNPLCGRNFEYYSEDPVLSGTMGAAFVGGIQSHGVGASVKHFACNNQETNRGHNNALVGMRALREIYLKGFEICVKEASPWTLMTSYNSLNGLPVQESPWLITGILRNEWGFDGLVMTDWSIVPHNPAAQLHAGNDLFMPGSDNQVQDIIDGVRNGTIDGADLDRACAKVIQLGKRTWHGDKNQAPDLKRGAAVSKIAACESAVLLENRNMLPLETAGTAALFGVRSYNLVPVGSGSAYVVSPHVIQLNDAFREAGISTDTELEDLYLKYIAFASADIAYNEKVKVHIGMPLLPELELRRLLIEKAAERDGYAVITIGRTAEEGVDRNLKNDYYLSATERQLIIDVCEAFHSKGKKVAVVLNIAGIIETESWKNMPDAIINMWLPGQEGGTAICDLLTGRANPSGRLAVTFPVDYFDCPSAHNFPYDHPESGKNYDFTDYSEGIYVGYRHYLSKNVAVSYPFGYGLSYTDFEYSALKIKTTKHSVVITFNIRNSGSSSGREAFGIYVSAPAGGLDKPSRELKAFGKTGMLAPGESEPVRIEIPLSRLASYNEKAGEWQTARGQYTLYVGANVEKPCLMGNFRKI